MGPLAGLSFTTTALNGCAAKLALGSAAMNTIPLDQLNMLWAMAREAGYSHHLGEYIEFSLSFILCTSS